VDGAVGLAVEVDLGKAERSANGLDVVGHVGGAVVVGGGSELGAAGADGALQGRRVPGLDLLERTAVDGLRAPLTAVVHQDQVVTPARSFEEEQRIARLGARCEARAAEDHEHRRARLLLEVRVPQHREAHTELP
jgi:hypothetical protein